MAIQDLLRVEDAFRTVWKLAAERRKVTTELKRAQETQTTDTQKVRDLQDELVRIEVEIQAAADRIKPEINKGIAVG